MTTETVNFSIAGEFITDTTRNLVAEGDWRKALSILDTLDGFTYEMQVALLKCEQKLVGVNELELEDDSPEDNASYISQLDYLYGGIVEHNGKWYRPYAQVTSFDYIDRKHAKEQNNPKSDITKISRTISTYFYII